MPSTMKQIRLPVTADQEAILNQLADGLALTEYLRKLIEADAARRGVAYPSLAHTHGGNRRPKAE